MGERLSRIWLMEAKESPEKWSIRDRDDIVIEIERRQRQLERTPEDHQPVRGDRERALAELEDAMSVYIESRGP